MKYILYAICLSCFIVSLFVDNVHISKWFNYVGLAILIMYVFLIQHT
jgi:hypothetical protein